MINHEIISQKREKQEDKPIVKLRRHWQALKWAGIGAGAVLLYRWGAAWALEERGYQAVGGEILLLLIPLLYYIVERLAQDFAQDVRTFWTEDEEE